MRPRSVLGVAQPPGVYATGSGINRRTSVEERGYPHRRCHELQVENGCTRTMFWLGLRKSAFTVFASATSQALRNNSCHQQSISLRYA